VARSGSLDRRVRFAVAASASQTTREADGLCARTPSVRFARGESLMTPSDWVDGAIACRDAGIPRGRSSASWEKSTGCSAAGTAGGVQALEVSGAAGMPKFAIAPVLPTA
jgi:hypothetical protein